jgi:hypothetical protein
LPKQGLERPDQLVGAGFPVEITDDQGVPAREGREIRRQLVLGGHHGAADKHWDDRDPTLQRRSHFDPDEVAGVLEPPPVLVRRGQPRAPDDDDQRVGRGNRRSDLLDEVVTETDGVDVYEDLRLSETLDKVFVDEKGVTRIVLSAIADEDARRGGPPPLATSTQLECKSASPHGQRGPDREAGARTDAHTFRTRSGDRIFPRRCSKGRPRAPKGILSRGVE